MEGDDAVDNVVIGNGVELGGLSDEQVKRGAARLQKVWYEECTPPGGGKPLARDLWDMAKLFAEKSVPKFKSLVRKAAMFDHIAELLSVETDPRTYGGAVRRIFTAWVQRAESAVSFVADSFSAKEETVKAAWSSLGDLMTDTLRPSLSQLIDFVLWRNGSKRSDALPQSTSDAAFDWVHHHCRYNMVG